MRIKPILIFCAMIWSMLICLAFAEGVDLISEQVRIPSKQSRTFAFTVPANKNDTILIDILARIDAESFTGSSYLMKLILNGKLLTARKTRVLNRLYNKKLISLVSSNLTAGWFGGDHAWRVLYGPNFEGALKFSYYEGNPYQTLLDVTDLVVPGSTNRLEIINLYKGENELVLNRVSIRQKYTYSPMLSESIIGVDQDIINHGETTSQPAQYTGEVFPGGGFHLNIAGHQIKFASRISFPYGGFNYLTPSKKSLPGCQNGYHVVFTPNEAGARVVAQGPDYKIERTIMFSKRKVNVTDKITNLQKDTKLGLQFDNYIDFKGLKANIRLAGNPDPSIDSYYSPGNPSVYAALKEVGVGMLCEDDVFRNQAELYFDPQTLTSGLRTRMLCLPKGGVYTLKWSVYPVASNDYYDFINLVRQDWGANYMVDGAWMFFNPDDVIAYPFSMLVKQFSRLGIKYACSWGGWVDRKLNAKEIGFGTGVFDPYWKSYRNRLRTAAEKIRNAAPGCTVLIYYNTQRDTSKNGPEQFRDSWLTDRSDKQLSTVWDGSYNRTYSVVATTENSFGAAMLDIAGRYLSELKADGLYWDEMEGVDFGKPLLTYAIPDGYSCILKDNNTIEREVGITTLLGETHRLAVINKVRGLGGKIMGNGPICTKDILMVKPQRMVEINHNSYWSYEGNLDSPLGYAGARMDFGNWIRALKMATLLVGTRINYSYDIPKYVFPFTPIELHSGYLLGEERIIVTHSGNFGWPNEKNLVQVRHFNVDGEMTLKNVTTIIDQKARTKIEIGENDAAVLVKLPIEIIPHLDKLAVSDVRYGSEVVRFKVTKNNGFTIIMKTGEFSIKPESKFRITINQENYVVTAGERGLLQIVVAPASAIEDIEIVPLEAVLNPPSGLKFFNWNQMFNPKNTLCIPAVGHVALH